MELRDKIDLTVAIGTGLLGIATFLLAAFTWRMAAEAKKVREQEAEHHQENLRPFCLIEFWQADSQNPFGSNFATHPASRDGAESRGEKSEISLIGKLHNKGLGPAKDVVAYLNLDSSLDGQGSWLTHPVVVCGVIGAGETIDINISITKYNIVIKMAGGEWAPLQVMEWVSRDTYEVVLRYRDTFDNWFRTVHPKGFIQNVAADLAIAGGNKELESLHATRPNKPTPVFLKDQQPWRTLADMPQRSGDLEG